LYSKVVRRPFMFVYNNEKDRVERAVINLGTTNVEFSEETQAMIRVRQLLLLVKNLTQNMYLVVEFIACYFMCTALSCFASIYFTFYILIVGIQIYFSS